MTLTSVLSPANHDGAAQQAGEAAEGQAAQTQRYTSSGIAEGCAAAPAELVSLDVVTDHGAGGNALDAPASHPLSIPNSPLDDVHVFATPAHVVVTYPKGVEEATGMAVGRGPDGATAQSPGEQRGQEQGRWPAEQVKGGR